jgi:zinc protease
MTAAEPWRFPASGTTILDSGIRVKLVDMPGRIVATVAVIVALPTEVETPETEGAVSAYATMMLSDAPHSRSAGISDVATIGATVTTGCDHRGPKVIADCAMPHLPQLLSALAAMLLRFDPTRRSFEQCRQRRSADRDLERHNPFGQANKLFNESVVAPTSRYSRPVGGTGEAWHQLRLDDIVDLHERYVQPQHMTVVVVGDLSLLDVAGAVAAAFGGRRSSDVPAATDLAPMPAGTPLLSWRAGRSDTQTHLMIGGFAIDRLDPRWPSARTMAELLGGGPDALLNVELRGRLGLTYGIEAKFLPYFSGGLFVVSGTVDGARSVEAVDTICATLRRVVDEGVDEDRFTQVRDRMVSSAPETYESTLAVAQQSAELVSCGIGEEFIDAHLDQLRRLDPATLREDIGRLIDPDRLHVAVVGRFDPDASVFAGLPRG